MAMEAGCNFLASDRPKQCRYYKPADLDFQLIDKELIPHLHADLIPAQARDHATNIKGNRLHTTKRLIGENEADRVLTGSILTDRESGDTVAYTLHSIIHGTQGKELYLEDVHTVEDYRSKGVGSLKAAIWRIMAEACAARIVSCTVDADRHKTLRFYQNKLGMARHPVELLDFTKYNGDRRNMQVARRLERKDLKAIAKLDAGDFTYGFAQQPRKDVVLDTVRDVLSHPLNFAVIRKNWRGRPLSLSFASVSTSTFHNHDGLNLSPVIALNGKTPTPADIFTHAATAEQIASDHGAANHVKLQLDPAHKNAAELQPLFRQCAAQMTDNPDSRELRLWTYTDDIQHYRTEIPPHLRQQLSNASFYPKQNRLQ